MTPKPWLVLLVLTSAAQAVPAAAAPATPPGQAQPPLGRVMTLEEAVRLAEANNTDLKIDRQKLIQADALIDKAWALIKPTLTWVGTYTHYDQAVELDLGSSQKSQAEALASLFDAILRANAKASDNLKFLNADEQASITGASEQLRAQAAQPTEPVVIQKQDSFGMTLTLTQPVFNGRSLPLIRNTYENYRLAELTSKMKREILVTTVAQAYYTVLATTKIVRLSEDAIVNLEKHLAVARERLAAGVVTRLFVLRAEIDLAINKNTLRVSQIAHDKTKEALAVLVGVDTNFDVIEPPPEPPPLASPQMAIDTALSSRMDLRAAEISQVMAERQKSETWWKFVPALNFFANLRGTDASGFSGDNFSWSLGLTLTAPLYDGGIRYAELRERESLIVETLLRQEKIRRDIAAQVRSAFMDVAAAREALETARKQEELAKEQMTMVMGQFDAGVATSLEISDATRLLAAAQTNLAREELEYQVALLKARQVLVIPVGASSSSTTGTSAAGTASGASEEPSASAPDTSTNTTGTSSNGAAAARAATAR